MYPFYPRYSSMGMGGWPWRRGPSRLLWFLLGAGSAAWFIKSKEASRNGERWGHCKWHHVRSVEAQATAAPHSNANNTEATNDTHHHHHHGWSVKEITRTINNTEQPTTPPNDGKFNKPWGTWEDEQFAEMSKQATEKMTELTEATLDSVLVMAQSMKTKLAEHRAEREKQQKELERQQRERERNPPRLV